RPARGEPPVEARALAVRVHDADPALADQPRHLAERERGEPVRRDLHHLRARGPKALEIWPAGGRAHDDAELLLVQPAEEIRHMRGPAAELARDQQLENGYGRRTSGHVRRRPRRPARGACAGGAPAAGPAPPPAAGRTPRTTRDSRRRAPPASECAPPREAGHRRASRTRGRAEGGAPPPPREGWPGA